EHLERDGDSGAAIDGAINGPKSAAADLALDAEWTQPASHKHNLTRTTRRAAFLLWCARPHASYRTGHRPAQGRGAPASAPAPCGHHHGRKWALGRAAGASPPGGPPPRQRLRPGGHPGGATPRTQGAHALRLLFAELAAAPRRGGWPHGPAARLPQPRAARDHGERHPVARHRP